VSCCPITYESCRGRYSKKGLRLLSPALSRLDDFPYSASEQIREAAVRAGRMSIQGVQPKLSAVLLPSRRCFSIVDTGGKYILKPQHPSYAQLPENEDLTMRLASLAGIDVPVHGLLRCVDGTLTYFVRRFDRIGRSGKAPVEDFAQLSGRSRDTKYDSSMEQVAKVVDQFCTFPLMERSKLFARTLFCFLTGNEDMHLKNFSLITAGGKMVLSPAYDMVNTTLVLGTSRDEVALPLRGKLRKLSKSDWIEYWGAERLRLPRPVMEKTLRVLSAALPAMNAMVERSFLEPAARDAYLTILEQRAGRLDLRSPRQECTRYRPRRR